MYPWLFILMHVKQVFIKVVGRKASKMFFYQHVSIYAVLILPIKYWYYCVRETEIKTNQSDVNNASVNRENERKKSYISKLMIYTVGVYFLGMMSRYLLFFYKQNHLNLIASVFDNRSLIKSKYFISALHLRIRHTYHCMIYNSKNMCTKYSICYFKCTVITLKGNNW